MRVFKQGIVQIMQKKLNILLVFQNFIYIYIYIYIYMFVRLKSKVSRYDGYALMTCITFLFGNEFQGIH